jgi:hypothetical protein
MIFTVKIINTFLPTRTVIGYIANKEERGEIIQSIGTEYLQSQKIDKQFFDFRLLTTPPCTCKFSGLHCHRYLYPLPQHGKHLCCLH